MSTALPVISDDVVSREESREPAVHLDPRAYRRGLSCVHCGLCLPACPTYTETGNEADSPRGRIQLMLGLHDGRIDLTPGVKKHLDLCLDCRGCETACPSGVVYHELIEDFRARVPDVPGVPAQTNRLMRFLFLHVFTHPTRLKLALLPARLMQKIGLYGLMRGLGLFKLLPAQLRKMEQMLPAEGKLWPSRTTGVSPVHGQDARGTASFFTGCIGSVMFGEVNRKSVELLGACGTNVVVPRDQVCCGAIHHHNGEHRGAKKLARQNVDAFERSGASLIVTNIAGCGAMLREYDVLLRDDPDYADRAAEFVSKVRDVSEAIVELGPPQMTHPVEATITYHDACHLAHAQRITAPPRALLGAIPGLRIIPLPECDMCCGAAGTYNLTQPEMATRLAQRKLDNIASTQAQICATGNVGCALHIQSQADARGQKLRVVHPVELLHRAVFGE